MCDKCETYGHPADRQILAQAQTDVVRVIKVTDNVTLHVREDAKDSHVKTIINVLTELQNNYPAPGKVDVFYPVNSTILSGDPTMPAQAGTLNVTNLEPDRFGKDRFMIIDPVTFSGLQSDPGWTMPAVNVTSTPAFVLTHEWGHVIDVVSKGHSVDNSASAMSKFVTRYGSQVNMLGYRIFSALSQYGQTSPAESYAEAFAEWAITNGETDNFAANWYAKEFGWPKRTMNLPANTSSRYRRTNNLPQLAFLENQYLYNRTFN